MDKIVYSFFAPIILLFFIHPTFLNSDNDWQEPYNQSLDYLYNGEYEQAIDCLEKAKELNPDNPMIYWRLTFAFWFKAEYGKNAKSDIDKSREKFNQAFNKGVAICNSKSIDSEILFYLGGFYSNRVLFKQAAGQRNMSMLRDVNNAREYLEKISKAEDFYYEACVYLGIFNYGPVLMSGFEKWIVRRAGYKWDEDKGLGQIKDAIEYSRHSDDIKILYYGILTGLIEKKEHQDKIRQALELVESLAEKYPRSPIFKKDLETFKKLLKNKKSHTDKSIFMGF